jgi:hypothetical protein
MYDIRNSVLIGKADQVISTAGKSNIPALDEQIAKIAAELSKLSDAL